MYVVIITLMTMYTCLWYHTEYNLSLMDWISFCFHEWPIVSKTHVFILLRFLLPVVCEWRNFKTRDRKYSWFSNMWVEIVNSWGFNLKGKHPIFHIDGNWCTHMASLDNLLMYLIRLWVHYMCLFIAHIQCIMCAIIVTVVTASKIVFVWSTLAYIILCARKNL